MVPYPRNSSSQVGSKNVDFNRTFSLLRGYSTSDSGQNARLISDIASNLPTKIKPLAKGSGAYSNTGKRFRITLAKAGQTPVYKQSKITFEVNYSQLSSRIQSIHKSGGKIISITEIAS